jgi:hypothetical protein
MSLFPNEKRSGQKQSNVQDNGTSSNVLDALLTGVVHHDSILKAASTGPKRQTTSISFCTQKHNGHK